MIGTLAPLQVREFGNPILYHWHPVAADCVRERELSDHAYRMAVSGILIASRLLYLELKLRAIHSLQSELPRQQSALEERNRITREIHDGVGYTLTNIIMLSEVSLDACPDANTELHENIDAIRMQAKTGLFDTRRALRELRSTDPGMPLGMEAIRNGSLIMPTPLASKLFETSIVDAYHGGASEGSVPEWYYELSRKERHILRLIVDGYDNHEIAAEVNLAPQTVKNYSSGIYGKMGVHTRTDAIREAKSLIKYL